MKKFLRIVLLTVMTLLVAVPGVLASGVEKDNKFESILNRIASQKIEERIALGHKEFEGILPGEIIGMKDENEQTSNSLVVLTRANEVAGYLVINHSTGLIVEYSLGNSHPAQDLSKGNIYYFGSLFYASKISNDKYLDAKSKNTFDQQELKAILYEKQKNIQLNNLDGQTQSIESRLSGDVGTFSIIHYDYKLLSGVPDYQQNDNTSMNNDCVPTAAAAVMMYYDSNGYPNLSSSNEWKNVADRLGVLMNHNNTDGVLSSKIKPGLDSYIKEKGYTNFTVTRDTSVSISDIKSEINSTSPALLRVLGYGYNNPNGSEGGHLVTLVGFETYTETSDMSTVQYGLVQDNWESTGKTVYLLMGQFGTMTDLWKIRD